MAAPQPFKPAPPVQQITPSGPAFDPTQQQQAFFNASLRPPAQPAQQPSAVFDPTQAGAQQFAQLQQSMPPLQTEQPQRETTNPFLEQTFEKQEEQQKLEAEHGRFATFATQTARGALNAVLLAPALIGAGAEGAGKLVGWTGLERFGRDFGEASNGREALSTLFTGAGVEATKALFGGGDAQRAADSYESVRRDIEAQSEAWPLLSTVSRIAGGTAVSFGVAGLASGGAAAAAEGASAAVPLTLGQAAGRAAAVGSLEGAEGGAQTAYETGRPYRDVVGSTIMGSLLGAATAATAAGAAHWLEHAEPKEALEDFARKRVFKAVGGIQSDIKKVGGVDEADRIAEDISRATLSDGETVLPKSVIAAARTSPDEIRERIAQGAEEYGNKLGNMQRQVGVYLDEHAREMLPKVAYIRDKLSEIAEPLEKSSQLAPQSVAVRGLIDDVDKAAREDGTISLLDLIRIKRQNYQAIAPSGDVPPATKEALDRAGGILSGYINDVADAGAMKMGGAEAGAYKELNRVTRSFIQARMISERGAARLYGNRAISLTDSMTGAAAFAADLAGGGGAVSAAKGLGAALVHKFARERGSAVMAALAEKLAESPGRIAGALEKIAGVTDKFGEVGIGAEAEALGASAEEANQVDKIGIVGGTLGGSLLRDLGWKENRDSRIISVRDAGGREAQSVIAELGRAKERIQRAATAAGENPIQRQTAQANAHAALANSLALKAGPYAAADWQSDPPTPLQRVLYRSDLLDATSRDMAAHAAAIAATKPQAQALELDPARVRKLTRDANAPLAIGGVQQALQQAMQQTNSPIVHGAAMRTLSAISTSDAPQTLIAGHEFLKTIAQLSNNVDAATRADIGIATQIAKRALSDKAFGAAGRAYAALDAPTNTAAAQLLDPIAVREALRNAVAHGTLTAATAALQQNVDAAHDAARALTGAKTKAPKNLSELAHKAEQAMLLDGGPAGRVFDFFRPGESVATPSAAPQTTVIAAVKPQIQQLLAPRALDQTERYNGAPLARRALAPRPLPKTLGDLQALYSERLQDLATATQAPPSAAPRGLPTNIHPAASATIVSEAHARAQQLLADLPKPKQDLRGAKLRGLSSEDLRRADAMFEATVDPMSVFADFKRGAVDYDKVRYAWKQYPGLQQAAQAGLLDTIHTQLSDTERAAISDSTLTQLDYLLGFNGQLQPSIDRSFSARVSAIADQEAQRKPPPNAQLALPESKPTFTERLANSRARA